MFRDNNKKSKIISIILITIIFVVIYLIAYFINNKDTPKAIEVKRYSIGDSIEYKNINFKVDNIGHREMIVDPVHNIKGEGLYLDVTLTNKSDSNINVVTDFIAGVNLGSDRSFDIITQNLVKNKKEYALKKTRYDKVYIIKDSILDPNKSKSFRFYYGEYDEHDNNLYLDLPRAFYKEKADKLQSEKIIYREIISLDTKK